MGLKQPDRTNQLREGEKRFMETYLSFECISHDVIVSDLILSNAAKAALKTIEHELPPEARTHAVYDFVLNECKRTLNMIELKLE